MFRKSRVRRTVALLLLANMIFYIFTPMVAYASLTAGPTAPEYTSFEPIDTTDMVNLATGDLTYNIPLLEVPGPEGGFPVSLAYHGGIQPAQEASWVGLGWNFNAGAINRYVDGYADDYLRKTKYSRQYIEGEERTSYDIGFTPGNGNSNIKFGLTIDSKENGGFGGPNFYAKQTNLLYTASFSTDKGSSIGLTLLNTDLHSLLEQQIISVASKKVEKEFEGKRKITKKGKIKDNKKLVSKMIKGKTKPVKVSNTFSTYGKWNVQTEQRGISTGSLSFTGPGTMKRMVFRSLAPCTSTKLLLPESIMMCLLLYWIQAQSMTWRV